MRHLIIVLFLFCISANAQYKSPFNKKEWIADSTNNYSFIVSGHFYGGSGNVSHYPANTLLANLDWINNSDAGALICLGDLFKSIVDDRPFYEESFFNKLNIPLINTVGNHDLTGTVYQDNYGKTSFSFVQNGDIHIIIDTEIDNGDISGDNLVELQHANDLVNSGQINNVFIYGHRTIWKDAYPEMEGLFTENTQGLTETNFEEEVIPILKDMDQNTNVYWFSGSLGPAPASFFHFEDTDNGFEIIGTAIRALPRDAVLMVNVIDGEVSFELHSFTGETLNSLESYNVDLWKNTVGKEPFNWKLTVYYFELIFTHRYFWYGCFYTLIGVFIVSLFLKRRRKKKTA